MLGLQNLVKVYLKMGGSSSVPETQIDNKGLANGNVINNGNINLTEVNTELKHIELTLYFTLVVKILLVLIILVKWYTKRVRKSHDTEQKLNEIILDKLKRGEN